MSACDLDTPLPAGRAAWLAERILPHEPALRAWLGGRLALPAQDVDDIVQESYAKLAGLADVEHVREPRAYLYTVARSLVHQHLRRAQVVAIETMAELDGLGVHAPNASPERFVSSRQQLALAQRLLAGLPTRCRQVFRLRRIEGLSQREISTRLKISQSTVEKHMVKALRLLMAGVQAGDGSVSASRDSADVDKGERSHGRG
ncbi:RNA polymerase sigma factor [Luteimonas sp. A277]